MRNQTLSFIVLISTFLLSTEVIGASSVDHWKLVGDECLYHDGIKWIGSDDTGRSVYKMCPTIATPPGDGILTRLTGWLGTYYLWNGWLLTPEPDPPPPDDDDDEPTPQGNPPDTNKPKPKKQTIEIDLDPALVQGHFLSTDTKHRVKATTEATKVTWSVTAYNNSGSLNLTPPKGKTVRISFVLSNRKSVTTGKPLSYRIVGKIPDDKDSRNFKQDDVSALQQQYIDFNRQRWNDPAPTVPKREEFKTSYSTANYSFQDYGQGRSRIIMHMGPVAEKIRKHEGDSVYTEHLIPGGEIFIIRYYPNVTSGYREPTNRWSKISPKSLHQWGYGLDMNPQRPYKTRAGREAMVRRTRRLIGTANYDTEIHAKDKPNEHVHIEQQTIAQGGSANR